MRTPRNRSPLTGACTPCVPQSSRPRVCSTDMNSRLPWTDMSPWPPGQTIDALSFGLLGALDVVGVEAMEAAEEEWVPLNARSELVNASMFANRGSGGASGSSGGRLGSRSGGVAVPAGAFGSKNPPASAGSTICSMFRAASPASRRPGLSPTRGIVVRGGVGAPTGRAAIRARGNRRERQPEVPDFIGLPPNRDAVGAELSAPAATRRAQGTRVLLRHLHGPTPSPKLCALRPLIVAASERRRVASSPARQRRVALDLFRQRVELIGRGGRVLLVAGAHAVGALERGLHGARPAPAESPWLRVS